MKCRIEADADQVRAVRAEELPALGDVVDELCRTVRALLDATGTPAPPGFVAIEARRAEIKARYRKPI